MRHFATHFDVNYLSKGLTMIESLLQNSLHPMVHVLAMDEETKHALHVLANGRISIYSMPEFESATGSGELRSTRTHREFCWTVGSVFTDFVMQFNDLHEVTYCDADVFFFADPEPVFTEIGDKSIAITPHRFAKKDEARLLPNGKYAVQWVTFRGEVGRRCLAEWSKNVKAWCKYENAGPGRFADQGYLDFFERDYPGEVCEIQHPGVGLAPWNIANYHISDGPKVDGWPVIMYHFHEYIHRKRLTNWKLRPEDIALIYEPYSAAIERNTLMLESLKVEAQRA